MNIVDWVSSRFESLRERYGERRFYPLFLGGLLLVGLIPLLMPGLPNGHDLYYHLSRLHAMDVNFSLGEFPSMINHEALAGYGYASGLFYPDFFLYPAVLLMKCGLGIVAAYKCLLVLCVAATAFGAYYCARRLSATCFGAFATALLYTWSSYFAVDLFVRSSFGEWSQFVFAPWIILGLYEVVMGDPRRFFYLSFGFAGLVLAHSLSLFMMTVICAVFIALNIIRLLREPRRILCLVLAPLPTVLVGLVALLPMCEQFMHLHFHIEVEKNADILSRCMPFLKLILEIPTSKAEFWIPSGVGTMLAIVALQRFRLASRRTAPEVFRDMLLIVGLCCLLMSTDMPSWKGAFKPLAVIQFPWRFFGPATAFLAFGGGLALSSLVGEDRARERSWVWLVMCGAAFAWFVNVGYFYAARSSEHDFIRDYKGGRPQEASGIHYLIRDGLLDNEIRSRGDVATSAHPLDVKLSRPQKDVLQVDFSKNAGDNDVELPILPYYGYAAQLCAPDGTRERLKVGLGPNKLLSVHIPRERASGVLSALYEATFLQRLSQLVSLVSGIAFLSLFIVLKRRRRKVEREA
jgi:hypothetical protein